MTSYHFPVHLFLHLAQVPHAHLWEPISGQRTPPRATTWAHKYLRMTESFQLEKTFRIIVFLKAVVKTETNYPLQGIPGEWSSCSSNIHLTSTALEHHDKGSTFLDGCSSHVEKEAQSLQQAQFQSLKSLVKYMHCTAYIKCQAKNLQLKEIFLEYINIKYKRYLQNAKLK